MSVQFEPGPRNADEISGCGSDGGTLTARSVIITTAALSFAGAGIILHTGIGLRWPFTPKTTHDP